MSCLSDPPSGSLRGLGLSALALAAVLGTACTGSLAGSDGPSDSSGGSGQTGAGGSTTAGTGSNGAGGKVSNGGTGAGTPSGATGGGSTSNGGTGGTAVLSKGGVMLRLLTQPEYMNSVQMLLGTLKAQPDLPDDVSSAGFTAVGATTATVTAADAYENAALAATAEVFADATRWQKLVGCAPKADLSDACVSTFIKTFGKSAFRRELTTDEVTAWLTLAKSAATTAGTAAQGLATLTSGFLQSPYFLYRVETNKLDASNGRLKYDGLSMATRLSYLLTGAPPSAALLTAATSGQLDTADGVKTAAAPLLADPGLADRMTAFFSEYVNAQQVNTISKSTKLYPTFNAALQASMYQSIQLFLKNVVLAPNADVRAFYDSDTFYVDANLAPLYGVSASGTGFTAMKLPASGGRAGILGQAGIIAAQSQVDKTSPTRRGIFIVETMRCITPMSPPAGVITDIPVDDTLTTRQQLEKHRALASCAGCHALFDPLGVALEHFDAIGKYRTTEKGNLPIDATSTVNGMNIDGEAQLGSAMRQDPSVLRCLMQNFYRAANGRAEDDQDSDQIDNMTKSLSARNYVWSNLLADFVVSDAFRSAPALPVSGSN